MAQPTPYEREFNFSNQQAATPTTPIPAPHLDAELNRVKLTLDQTLANLALIQSDEGLIAENIVGYDQLTEEVRDDLLNGTATIGTFEAALDSVFADAAEAGDGVDTVVGLKSGVIIRTPLPYITPEMHGAGGLGFSDDLDAILAAIEEGKFYGRPVFGRGKYGITEKFLLERPAGVEYWDGSTQTRPISIYLDRIVTTSIDCGVEFRGGLISDKLEIGHIIGPGMGAIGTPGGTDERIGVLLAGPADFKLGSATDFNFGVLAQELFSAKVEIGFLLACKKGFYARVDPSDANGTNQRNNIQIRKAGGAFTSEAFGNDALRRERSCDVGIHLASMHGSWLDLGSPEYCQQETDSVAVVIDAAVTKNTMYLYLEGARDDGEFFQCAGDDNNIHFSGLGSVSNVKVGAIRVTGEGNEIYGLGDTLGGASKAAFAPQGSFGLVQIAPGNTVHGKYKQQVQKAPSILRMNLLTDATAFTASSGGLTVSTSTSDVPLGHDFKESYEFTVGDSSVYWYTSGNITVTSETREKVRVKTAVRGITNHPKIAFYLMTSGGTLLSADHSITADPNDADWSVIEYIANIGAGLTNILFRYSIRQTSPGETGGVLRACRPIISYNLTGDLVRSNTVMPHDKSVWGVIPKNMRNMQGFSYEPYAVTDIAATVFDVNSSALAVCTAHPSGASVNLINSMIDNQPVMILNKSGSDITFTTSALNGAAVVLADGEGFTVVRYAGDSKATRVG